MEVIVKHFSELTAGELHDIYMIRTAVFIIEQKHICQEVDSADREAYHVWLRDKGGIRAYLRVLPAGARFDDVSIGRVIAVDRRKGLGSQVMREGIRVAREKLGADRIVLEAQTYAREFYEKCGFVKISDEFFEDDIPHIQMMLKF